jgi:hypothetical protein
VYVASVCLEANYHQMRGLCWDELYVASVSTCCTSVSGGQPRPGAWLLLLLLSYCVCSPFCAQHAFSGCVFHLTAAALCLKQ